MYDTVKLGDYYSLEQALDLLRQVLTAVKGDHVALELLEKAVDRARSDQAYANEMKEAILFGSTIEWREMFSVFGAYFQPPRAEFPFYPHSDAVNKVDSALGAIKFDLIKPGHLQERIDFVNFLRS